IHVKYVRIFGIIALSVVVLLIALFTYVKISDYRARKDAKRVATDVLRSIEQGHFEEAEQYFFKLDIKPGDPLFKQYQQLLKSNQWSIETVVEEPSPETYFVIVLLNSEPGSTHGFIESVPITYVDGKARIIADGFFKDIFKRYKKGESLQPSSL
ncbi:MAG TPA: hypothetical protein VE439_05970, partial [Anaerolineae bacterium]|nr:hypothetical protein [Anaerolineae bacterium]